MLPQYEIQLIAFITASACSLMGVYLVLRKNSMLSVAISHSILLGIVIAFLIVKNLHSPFLIAGAAISGVITVYLTDLLSGRRLIKEDSAIGLVFPLLFSIGIILIAKYSRGIHLDIDTVLVGEIAFAPFYRFELFGYDIGSVALVTISVVFLLNVIFITLFFKELKITAFDTGLAVSLGFSSVIIHYLLMTMVSITAVAAFDIVGSILVVAFIIVPPATAYLISGRLSIMIFNSIFVSAISVFIGYRIANMYDASISGAIAFTSGIILLIVFLFEPRNGLIIKLFRKRNQKLEFYSAMFLFHLHNHSLNIFGNDELNSELNKQFNNKAVSSEKIANILLQKKYIELEGSYYIITNKGMDILKFYSQK